MGKRRLAAAALGFLGMAAAGVSPADNPFATAPVDGTIPALPGGDAATALAEDLVSVGACKADGTLLGEADILSIGAPGQAPKAKPGSCGS